MPNYCLTYKTIKNANKILIDKPKISECDKSAQYKKEINDIKVEALLGSDLQLGSYRGGT